MGEDSPIHLQTRLVAAEDLVTSDLDGEIVMLDIESGKYHSLDAIGSRIWALLETPRSVAQICNLLMREYDVERPHCEADVLAFLNDLAGDRIVRSVLAAGALAQFARQYPPAAFEQ